MQLKCISNSLKSLDKKLSHYAFGQDETGEVDITVDHEYRVYGIRKNQYGTFYLMTTDEVNKDLPWWVPAGLFTEYSGAIPDTWIKQRYGWFKNHSEVANKHYFGHELDIEDGTKDGYEAFKRMKLVEE